MNKRNLIWSWWSDPLGEGDGPEYVDAEVEAPPDRDTAFYQEDDETPHTDLAVRPFVATTGGIVPLKAYSEIWKNFNFWVLHTNFDLGDDEVLAINNTPGVETLEVMTAYRGRVAIGLAFDDKEVRDRVDAALGVVRDRPGQYNPGQVVLDAEARVDLERRVARERARGGSWAILALPGGRVDVRRPADEALVAALREAAEGAGGVVYTP